MSFLNCFFWTGLAIFIMLLPFHWWRFRRLLKAAFTLENGESVVYMEDDVVVYDRKLLPSRKASILITNMRIIERSRTHPVVFNYSKPSIPLVMTMPGMWQYVDKTRIHVDAQGKEAIMLTIRTGLLSLFNMGLVRYVLRNERAFVALFNHFSRKRSG